MKNWFSKNYRTIIIIAFLFPIITVAVVSISHVTMWYGLSNPITWSLYLSVGIEIAALSALAAISANMGSKVYFPFIVVTIIQFIGNIFFSYSYIDVDSKIFIDWVQLVSPLMEFISIQETDLVSHKRVLALFSGGILPIISLSFLHMLVKFTEEDRVKEENLIADEHKKLVDNQIIEEEIDKYKQEHDTINASDLVGEISRVRLTDDDLKILEKRLLDPKEPNQVLEDDPQDIEQTKDIEETPTNDNFIPEEEEDLPFEMNGDGSFDYDFIPPYDSAVDNEPLIDFSENMENEEEMTSFDNEVEKKNPNPINTHIEMTKPQYSDSDLQDLTKNNVSSSKKVIARNVGNTTRRRFR